MSVVPVTQQGCINKCAYICVPTYTLLYMYISLSEGTTGLQKYFF